MDQLLVQKMERIKLSDFLILNELNRLTSIREVARLMKTTPVQISRRLKMLEKNLGCKIFERGPKGLFLTGPGHQVVKFSTLVNEELQNTIVNRRQKKSVLEKPLGIASTSFLLSYLVVPALAESLKAQSDFRSYLIAFNPDDLVAAGVKGAYKMAVHPTAFDWPRTWQSELVGHVRWGLFARKDHPLVRGKAQVEEVPFVYPMMWDGTKLVVQNDFCPLPVSQRNSFIGTQTAEQAMHLVCRSNVVGFLPVQMMKTHVDRKEVVEVKIPHWPTFQQSVYLSLHTDSVSENKYRLMKSSIQEILQNQES